MKWWSKKQKNRSWAASRKRSIPFKRIFLTIFSVIAGIALLGFLTGIILYINKPTTLPFRNVQISTDKTYVTADELRPIALSHCDGGFFSLNIKVLQNALMEVPWVKEVSVRRIWPDILQIKVIEQTPMAVWNNNSLLSDKGQLFTPNKSSFPQGLPLFFGPGEDYSEVLAQYREFIPMLAPMNLGIQSIEMTPRHAWRLILTNGVPILLGQEKIHERFLRFIAFYTKMSRDQADQIAGIDLRYSNGFAIQWKNSLKQLDKQ